MEFAEYSDYDDPRHHVTEMIWDDDAKRGSIPRMSGSYYRGGLLDGLHLAAKTVINTTDWHAIPDDSLPECLQSASSARHPAEVRQGVRRYTRHRGELVHADILGGEPREEPFSADDVDWTEVQKYLARSEIAPDVRDPDESLHEPPEALRRAAEGEATTAVLNWKKMTAEHDIWKVVEERKIVSHVDDVVVAGQIDLLAEKGDELVLFEFKTGAELHPGDILQTESYRRAIIEKLDAAIDAVLVRLGVREGDLETRASQDWQNDEIWDVFKRRYQELRHDDVVQMQIENAAGGR